MDIKNLKLHYDGKYDWIGGDGRSFTVLSHTVVNGRDLYKCTFTGAAQLMNILKGEAQ